MTGLDDVSIIVVSWNTADALRECLRSLQKAGGQDGMQLVVVDNHSSDGSAEMVQEEFGAVQLIRNFRNRGYGRAANQGMRAARGAFWGLVNSDALLDRDALLELKRALQQRPRSALAGARLVSSNGRPQHSVDGFPGIATSLLNKSLLRKLFPHWFASEAEGSETCCEVPSLVGACVMVRAEAAREVGLFDEGYFLFLEETEWCHRFAREGWKVLFVPTARVTHLQGRSKRRVEARAKVEYLRSFDRYLLATRGRAAWLLVRVLRPFKLMLSFCLALPPFLLTLGLVRSLRRRVGILAWVLLWQATLCPRRMGVEALEEPEESCLD